jgi:hypothetical protein
MAKDSRREKLEARFLTITSVVVGLIAVPAFLSFLREPSVLETRNALLSGRAPASVAPHSLAALYPQDSLKEGSQNTVETFKINCNSPLKEINTMAHQVRIVAKDCPETFKLAGVVNKANGFTAALFENNRNISTDFIDLNVGTNSVHLNAKNSALNKVLIINRRAPASEENK